VRNGSTRHFVACVVKSNSEMFRHTVDVASDPWKLTTCCRFSVVSNGPFEKKSWLISRPSQILLYQTTITVINGLNAFILGTYLAVIKTYRTIILPVVLRECEAW